MAVYVSTMVYVRFRPAEALRLLYETGVRSAELSYDNFIRFREASWSSMWSEVIDVSRGLGISVGVAHLPYGDIIDSAVYSDHLAEKSIRRLSEWLDFYSKLGVEVAVIHIPYVPYRGLGREAKSRIIRFLSEVSRKAFSNSIVLAVENRLERGSYGSSLEDIIEVVESIGLDGIGVCLDVGHAVINGWNLKEALSRLGSRIIATHLHDNDGMHDYHRSPFEGVIDWGILIPLLKDLRNPSHVLEVMCSEEENVCRNVVKKLKEFIRVSTL